MTIEEKVKVLDMLDKSVSYSIIAEKFEIGKSAVSDLHKESTHLYIYDGHVSHCPQ